MQRVAVILGSREIGGGTSPLGLSPFLPRSDRAAIGLAIERFGGAVHAYCLGNDEEALRYALAAGAATAQQVHDPGDIEFGVLLVGGGGCGVWGDYLPARLAEHKRCAMVLEVLDVEPSPEGLIVTRDLGRGDREQHVLSGAAVLGISEEAPRLGYVSRHRRRAVSLSPAGAAASTVADPLAGASGPWEPVRPRARSAPESDKIVGTASSRMQALLGLSDSEEGASESEHVILADAETCARHLLRYLSHHGFLEAPGERELSAPGVAPGAGAPERTSGRQADAVSGHRRDSERAPDETLPGKPGPRRQRGPRPLGGDSRRPERRPRKIEDGHEPSENGSS